MLQAVTGEPQSPAMMREPLVSSGAFIGPLPPSTMVANSAGVGRTEFMGVTVPPPPPPIVSSDPAVAALASQIDHITAMLTDLRARMDYPVGSSIRVPPPSPSPPLFPTAPQLSTESFTLFRFTQAASGAVPPMATSTPPLSLGFSQTLEPSQPTVFPQFGYHGAGGLIPTLPRSQPQVSPPWQPAHSLHRSPDHLPLSRPIACRTRRRYRFRPYQTQSRSWEPPLTRTLPLPPPPQRSSSCWSSTNPTSHCSVAAPLPAAAAAPSFNLPPQAPPCSPDICGDEGEVLDDDPLPPAVISQPGGPNTSPTLGEPPLPMQLPPPPPTQRFHPGLPEHHPPQTFLQPGRTQHPPVETLDFVIPKYGAVAIIRRRSTTLDADARLIPPRNDMSCTIMYCHRFLLTKYDEEAEVVDALGEWSCPKYIGIWNCIVCITKNGIQPAGILIDVAKKIGLSSVCEVLLQGDQYLGCDKVAGVIVAHSLKKRRRENSFNGKADSNLPDDTDEKSKKAKNAFFFTVDVVILRRLCASLEHLHTFDPGGEVSPKLMFAMLFIVSWFPP